MSLGWEQFLDRIRNQADIADVAQRLGMPLTRPNSKVALALCPFHDDRRPSLHLYRNQGAPDAFHCFACNEHGDAIALVAKKQALEFRGAVEWLADFLGEPIPRSPGSPLDSEGNSGKTNGLERGLEIFRSLSKIESALFEAFCRERHFDSSALRSREICAASAGKISSYLVKQQKQTHSELRQLGSDLEAAGLLRRRPEVAAAQQDLAREELSDFFWDKRVIFAIRDHRGVLAGFAGRALSSDVKPKYLYTKGFERRSILYRLDRVFENVNAPTRKSRDPQAGWSFELYLVEGLLDALRLETLGFQACALMGSHLTQPQAGLLADLATAVARHGGALAIHFFLDLDEAGRKGTAKSVPTLWESLLQRNVAAVIDVVAPELATQVTKDPDDLLREGADGAGAAAHLATLVPTAQFLLAEILDCAPTSLDASWETKPPLIQQWALGTLEGRLTRAAWRKVFQRLRPLATAHSAELDPPGGWQHALRRFFGFVVTTSHADAPDIAAPKQTTAAPTPAQSDDQQLQLAHQLAMASRHRREFPIDEGSWMRLGTAFDAIVPFYRWLLSHDKAQRLEPYLAVYLPKSSGGLRLKAIPCPEDLTLQQYVLNELLRTYPDNPALSDHVPAVRWTDGKLRTTGWQQHGESVTKPWAVSFAYQVDMDVLEGRIPAGQRAMFRPFFECWKDFIRFQADGVAELGVDQYFPARLDIRSFYDRVFRSAVNDALWKPLERALSVEGFNPFSMAPLLGKRPNALERETGMTRARLIIDWLCDQSFNYPYIHPTSGESRRSQYSDMGLPQGPDLSAYLANIVLFRLDQRVTEAIDRLSKKKSQGEPTSPAAVYARYVDDIVLITTSAEDLGELQSLIEFELATIGLSLSIKTETLPSMTREKVRRWLTDHRSLGTEYGPVPGIDPNLILASQNWGDAGLELDRGLALQLLHGQSVTNLVNRPDEVRESIKLARIAKLRPGDESVIAKLLWITYVAQLGEGSNGESKDLVAAIQADWQDSALPRAQKLSLTEAERETEDFHEGWPSLALLEGLHLALNTRLDRSPLADSAEQKKLWEIRHKLATLIELGLCNEILGQDILRGRPITLQKSAWCHVLLAAASAVLRPNPINQPPRPVARLPQMSVPTPGPTHFRFACTLHSAYPNTTILQDLGSRPIHADPELFGYEPLLYLHEAVARLTASPGQTTSDKAGVDVLQQIRSAVHDRNLGADPLWQILQAWLPEDPQGNAYPPMDHELLFSAVRGFVNSAGSRTPDLLNHRPTLRSCLFSNYGLPPQTTFLAVPPAVDYPGILAVFRQSLFSLIFKPATMEITSLPTGDYQLEKFTPRDLQWKKLPSQVESTWLALHTDLGNWQLEYQRVTPAARSKSDSAKTEALQNVVAAFRFLWNTESESWSSIPTGQHILRRSGECSTGQLSGDSWAILGFELPAEQVGNQAFIIQRHSGSLLAEQVPADGAYVWRIGFALTDLYFGIDRGNADLSLRLSSKDLALDDGQSLALEMFTRLTLARLRGTGSYFRPFKRATVERTLNRADRFALSYHDNDPAHLLSLAMGTLLESRLASRPDLGEANERPTSSDVLCRTIRRFLGADAKLSSALPESSNLPAWFPLRRPARAWLALAERIDLLPRDGVEDFLNLLVCGLRLLGLNELIRALALERWALLASSQRTAQAWSFSLVDWGIADDELYIAGEDKTTPETLLAALAHGSAAKDLHALEAITPLGWLSAFAGLAGLLPGNKFRPPLDRKVLENVSAPLKDLALLLAERLRSEGEVDREFLSLVQGFAKSPGFTQMILDSLSTIDKDRGIQVYQEESHSLFYSGRRGSLAILHSDRYGARELPFWTIQELRLADRAEQWEEAPRRADDQLVRRRATLVGFDETLIGVGWISDEMAKLSGLKPQILNQDLEPNSETGHSISGIPMEFPGPPEGVEFLANGGGIEARSIQANLRDPEPGNPSSNNETNCNRPENPSSSPANSESLALFQMFQANSWRKRGARKSTNTARIAFLQWSVEESYRHPRFELCSNDSRHQVDGQAPGQRSCSEHRRRGILKEVLKACNDFKVEILLLPEYSVRPDTVDWLVNSGLAFGDTTIWAGTYRLAPGFKRGFGLSGSGEADQRSDWSAILSVVSRSPEPTTVYWRPKKYPSVALSEVFNPNRGPLEPIYKRHFPDARTPFDPRKIVLELICSEIFLVTSPSNWRTLAAAFSELSFKFQPEPITAAEAFEKDILGDVRNLADYISYMSLKEHPRRSVLLVPAMTTRTADYASLGQLNYLSAGITTVFCNTTKKAFGHGNSCFIGHDCWDNESGKSKIGMPTLSPYHGPEPGIFRQYEKGRGWLSLEEQALVIADIDPLHSMEGKPRPQALLPPLNLVAHLPIIESWEKKDLNCPNHSGSSAKSKQREQSCTCSKMEETGLSSKDFDFNSFVETLKGPPKGKSITSTRDDRDPAELASHLRALAARASHYGWDWLCRRADAYEKEARNDPAPWPPPVALDWLWVDLGKPGQGKYPDIEVPPYLHDCGADSDKPPSEK